MTDTDGAWRKYGELAPYYGVMTHSKFLGPRLTENLRAEFFAAGNAHATQVLSNVEKLAPDLRLTSALDFGCGTGRVLIPLARRIGRVVGVDISGSMLDEARRNCYSERVDVELRTSNDALTGVSEMFDLIHSFVVFQHISIERGLRITEALLDRLAPGGIAALHYVLGNSAPTWKQAVVRSKQRMPWVNGGINLLKNRPFRLPAMEMNSYRLADIEVVAEGRGLAVLQCDETQHGDYHGAVIYMGSPS